MRAFIELASTAAIIAIMHIFLDGFFEKKNYSISIWAAAYAAYGLLLTIISFVPVFAWIRLVYNTVAAIVLAIFLFRAKPIKAIFAGVSMSAILVLSEMLLLAVFSFLGLDGNSLTEYDTARMICQIISPTVGLLLVLILLGITRRKREAVSVPYILMLAPGNIVSILLGCEFCRIVTSGISGNPWLFLFAAVCLTYLNILAVFYAERVSVSARKQKEQEITEHHYAMQELYYNQLRSAQDNTRTLFHDIGKYMSAMRVLAAESKSDEAEKVLAEAKSLFDGIGNGVDVGNSVVNVILSEYKHRAEEHNIPFRYDVSIPKTLSLTASDIYILLGNTLDNAIEASIGIAAEQRKIDLKLKKNNNILFYQVRNTFSNTVRSDKDIYHGYGLKSVRKCIEKYHGDMSIVQTENVFELSARLDLSET